jgi:hypothetical protein
MSEYKVGQQIREDGPQTHLSKAGTPTSSVKFRTFPCGHPRAVSRWGFASSGMREIRSPTRSLSGSDVSQNGYLSCGGWHARVSVVKVSGKSEQQEEHFGEEPVRTQPGAGGGGGFAPAAGAPCATEAAVTASSSSWTSAM